jgi:hypothetical protein
LSYAKQSTWIRAAVAASAAALVVSAQGITGCGTSGEQLTLKVAIDGQGTVTSRPAGILCTVTETGESGDCEEQFGAGVSSVTLTASAAEGWEFDGWTVTGGASELRSPMNRTQTALRSDGLEQSWVAAFKQRTETDGGTPDAGEPDAGTDAGMDGGEPDAGMMDAGMMDGGTPGALSFDKWTFPGQNGNWRSALLGPDTYLHMAGAQGVVARTDGQTYTQTTTGGTTDTNVLVASEDRILAISGNEVYRTLNGTTWSLAGTIRQGGDDFTAYAASFAAGVFVAVGYGTDTVARIFSSPDGETWTERLAAPVPGLTLADVTWTGSRFIAVGAPNIMMASTDGISWGSAMQTATAGAFRVVASAPTMTLAVADAAGTLESIFSTNGGVTWAKVPATLPADFTPHVMVASVSGDVFLLAGSDSRVFNTYQGGWVEATVTGIPSVDLRMANASTPIAVVGGDQNAFAIGPLP